MSEDMLPGGSWEAAARLSVTIIVAYLAVIWVALVFWTYRDIRNRSRDPIIQLASVLLVLVFTFPGHWVYLILRPRQTLVEAYERSLEEEALLQELEDQRACPTCKRRVQDDYLVCPSCGVQLKEPCRQCTKPLSYAWMLCPYCGQPKPSRERPARPRQQGAAAPRGEQRPRQQPAPEKTAAATAGSGIVTRGAPPAGQPPREAPMPARPQGSNNTERIPTFDDAPLIDATRE